MSRFNTLKTMTLTLLAAASVGFIVQYGETAPELGPREVRTEYNKAPRTLMMSTNASGEAVFGVPNVVTSPMNHAANVQQVVAVDVVYTEFAVPRMGTILATPVIGCDSTLTAQRQPAAIVELTIVAPCFEDSAVTIHHENLTFSARTDSDGRAVVTVPALKTDAMFTMSVANVEQATTDIFVPELRQYDRAVLQWSSANNMRLHALEGGAQIGDPGHVWSASIHSAQDTREGSNGFVVYLGTTDVEIPYQAEVYTFPAGQKNRDGGVDLRIGVSVTDSNCGREVDASTIQTNAGQTLVKSDIAAQMPGCDRVGEVVFLSEKFADLTLASR